MSRLQRGPSPVPHLSRAASGTSRLLASLFFRKEVLSFTKSSLLWEGGSAGVSWWEWRVFCLVFFILFLSRWHCSGTWELFLFLKTFEICNLTQENTKEIRNWSETNSLCLLGCSSGEHKCTKELIITSRMDDGFRVQQSFVIVDNTNPMERFAPWWREWLIYPG